MSIKPFGLNKQLEIMSAAYQDLYDKYIRSNSDLHNLVHDTHKTIATLESRVEVARSYSNYQKEKYSELQYKLDTAVLKILELQSYCKLKDYQLNRRRELGATVINLSRQLHSTHKIIRDREEEITKLNKKYDTNV